MKTDLGIMIAAGALVALMVVKVKKGSLIIGDPFDGTFPGDPDWDHFPDTTVDSTGTINPSTGTVTNEPVTQIIPVSATIDYIGPYRVRYAEQISGTTISENLGCIKVMRP
jgi:hypothetical protein